jgi:hypothetical protein
VIHFHGGPVTPDDAAVTLWTRRHAMVSFENPRQTALAFEVCQTVRLDCGAFSKWRGDGSAVDVAAYADWVRSWELHPAFDGAIIPDAIDGDAAANDKLIAQWLVKEHMTGIPVWHLHEDVERLRYLVQCARGRVYPAVALGSSGQWATPGSVGWWNRMDEAMTAICDEGGRPLCKLHGLRMLSPTIFAHLPLAAADSCNVARNIGLDTKWTGSYAPVTSAQRALVLAERIEYHVAASRWSRRHGVQQNLELIG